MFVTWANWDPLFRTKQLLGSDLPILPIMANAGILIATVGLLTTPFTCGADATKPNIIFILTDDMGRGDLSALGGKQGTTPHLDKLAAEGTSFGQFYVASPICSASRTAFTTGMFPGRWRINSYLRGRASNKHCEQADWLDPKAPVVARAFKQAGYATAHFGKWHMGGGRDVQDAPLPSAYGFDESHVNMEGMGPRFEGFGSASEATLNSEDGRKYLRCNFTAYWVDRSLDFIKRHQDRPFYLELWPQDVHTPHTPSEESLVRTAVKDLPTAEHNFRAVLNEYDVQIGRLMDSLRVLGLENNTIVVFSADNGPEPSFDHARTLDQRGMKWSLYEGGIKEPFLVRWPGHIPAGKTNSTTVISSTDYFPTITKLAGIPVPADAPFDGIDQSDTWLGNDPQRKTPLFWEYGRKPKGYPYPKAGDKSPNVAVREGDWKLLLNSDGTGIELYNLVSDPKETTNLADQEKETAGRLRDLALGWRKSLP